jgi:hypothetical protein
VTDWGRSRRAALLLGLGPIVMLTAACASSTAAIPSATPSPSAASTTIAPGVSVDPSELALPPYSVSTSNPLPPGVSARKVVRDFIADNLIENRAIERGDLQLLQYAVTGGQLTIDNVTIARDQATDSRILSIDDSISSLAIGSEPDPNDSAAGIALNVQGNEQTTTRSAEGKVSHRLDDFHVIIWVVWSDAMNKYLRCDVSVL